MSRGFIEFLLVALPKVLGGIGTIVLNVVLLRYLGPEPFGMVSLCLAGIMLADAIIGSAFDMGVLRLAPLYRAPNYRHSIQIERAALLIKFLSFLACSLVLAAAARPLGRVLFHHPGSAHLIPLSCAAALGLLMLRTTLVHLQVERRFFHYGLLDLMHQGLRLGGVALLLACMPASPGRVLTAYALAPAGLFLLATPALGALWREGRDGAPALRELLQYVKWFLMTFSLTALVSRLDVFLLTLLASLQEVGIFSGAFIFAFIPELIGSYMAIVLSPRIMPAVRDGRFGGLFRTVQPALIGGAATLYLALLLGLGPLQGYLLPPAFTRSAPVILALLPGALATMASFPLTIPYLMFVRPTFLLRLECLLLPALALGYFLAIRRHGALGAAWVTSGSRLLKAAISQAWAWHLAAKAPAAAETENETGTLLLAGCKQITQQGSTQ